MFFVSSWYDQTLCPSASGGEMGLATKPASFGICGCTFPCLAHAHGSTCLGSECRPPEGMRFSEITACVFAGQRAEAWHFGERTGSMHAAELSPGTVRSRSRSRRVVIKDAWSRRRCHCPRHLCGLGCSAPSVMEGSGSFQSFQDSQLNLTCAPTTHVSLRTPVLPQNHSRVSGGFPDGPTAEAQAGALMTDPDASRFLFPSPPPPPTLPPGFLLLCGSHP